FQGDYLSYLLSEECCCLIPIHLSFAAKPISLVERCSCRSTVNNIPKGYIRELKFIHTPNCPFQVIAKLKTNKEVCVNPEVRWLKQYLKNALNKMKKAKQTI
uniref:Chemokine (C-X-C motif) ligand 12a (stromal cell-derived factor 1) n=1 Tax=Oryzias melastigma TaxID=30732 RepID=A0A3B3CZQ4_ORYME